jgi:predicted RNase H-like nuclease (RuvC/YqgF family)
MAFDIAIVDLLPPNSISREQQKRIENLNQQNRVLKDELEKYKIRVEMLQKEIQTLRQARGQASVIIVSNSRKL